MSEKKYRDLGKLRKNVEIFASVGMFFIAAGLVIPMTDPFNQTFMSAFKWVYSVGALMYIIARCVDVSEPGEPSRLKRLRRLEFWAGLAFAVGAFFWFYHEVRTPDAGPLGMLRDTVLFSLVGAMIQVIAAWMIYAVAKKNRC